MAKNKMNIIDYIAYILLVVGAINWGLIGFFNYNLVEQTLGQALFITVKYVYIVVGIAGLYALWTLIKLSK